MTPLQRIAMGMVIVLIPANFRASPSPEWAFYDALPDPIGWGMVVWGVVELGRHSDLDLGIVKWMAALALLVSIPMWFPQINHLLAEAYNPDLNTAAKSGQWFLSLPHSVFGLLLSREIGRAGQLAEDKYLASRFGLLCWGFGALVVLPAVAYGAAVDALVTPTLVLIAVVNIGFIHYLFVSHRRRILGGPGPRDWTKANRPPSP